MGASDYNTYELLCYIEVWKITDIKLMKKNKPDRCVSLISELS